MALIVWIAGTITSLYLFNGNKIDKNDERGLWVLTETVALFFLFIGLFILIYVFWHYGLNIEATIQKQRLREEKKKREKKRRGEEGRGERRGEERMQGEKRRGEEERRGEERR